MEPNHVAIVGASGATGHALTGALLRRGADVTVISRRREALDALFGGTEARIRPADALDADSLAAAVEGADLIVDAVGLPADRIRLHAVIARRVVAAAAGRARLLHVSSFWSYLPAPVLPIREDRRREGGNALVRARREAEDVLQAAGAAVVQLPDFFGPHVDTGSMQQALTEMVEGKPANVIGRKTTRREYVYVPDAMENVADLAGRDEAYGERWIVPGHGAIAMEEVARIAAGPLGAAPRLRPAGRALLWVLKWFMADLAAFYPMVADYARPASYDGSKLRGLLGEVRMRPYEETIPEGIEWLRGRRR